MRFFIVFFIANILLSGCQDLTSPNERIESPNIFFDLTAFFQKEKARLETINSFKKTVSINGQSEVKNLTQLDLDNEFSIFIASDINRPAWSDKYKVDSTFSNQHQLASITYSSLGKLLKTKKITIDFQNNSVSKIAIEKSTDNPVTQSKQYLTYIVGKEYSIQSEQALSLSTTKTINVKVEY